MRSGVGIEEPTLCDEERFPGVKNSQDNVYDPRVKRTVGMSIMQLKMSTGQWGWAWGNEDHLGEGMTDQE